MFGTKRLLSPFYFILFYFPTAPFHLLHKALLIKKWCEKCQNRRSNLVMFAHKTEGDKMLTYARLSVKRTFAERGGIYSFLEL